MNAFDGAGKPYRQSSYKTIVFVIVVNVIAIAVIWLAYAGAATAPGAIRATTAP